MIALLLFSVAWSGTHQPHMRPFFPSIQGSSAPSVGSWYEANLLFLRHISGICWHLWQLPLPPFQIFVHRHSSWDTHYTLLSRDGLVESWGRNASPLLPLLATQLDLVAALPSLFVSWNRHQWLAFLACDWLLAWVPALPSLHCWSAPTSHFLICAGDNLLYVVRAALVVWLYSQVQGTFWCSAHLLAFSIPSFTASFLPAQLTLNHCLHEW